MAQVHNILPNVSNGTGEGPHWDEKTQTLYFVEIPDPVISQDGRVFKWKLDSPASQVEDFKFENKSISFMCPTKQGKFILGANQDIIEFDWSTKISKVLHSVDVGKMTRINDAKCSPRGHLICGTMSLEKAPAVVYEEGSGSLFGLHVDKTLKVLDTDITISNGIAWTRDVKTMFYIDSIPRKVYAYDYNDTSLETSNKRTAIDFSKFPLDDLGYPDGCAIDTNDNLWVACYGVGKVVCFDINTEQRLQEILFPTTGTTSCCFGGIHMNELFVTSSRTGKSQELMKGSERYAGSVFKVTGLNAKGDPMMVFGA